MKRKMIETREDMNRIRRREITVIIAYCIFFLVFMADNSSAKNFFYSLPALKMIIIAVTLIT